MVKKKNRKNYHRISEKNRFNHSHERIIVALFAIFVVLSVIAVLNTAPEGFFNNIISGFAGKDILLDKTSYNGSEMLKGIVTLSMDTQDIIPGNATMTFSILTNASKCPKKYVCFNNLLIDWHVWNTTTQTCDLLQSDPEGECCRRYSTNCSQVITNKDFDAVFGGAKDWIKTESGAEGAIRQEPVSWIDELGDAVSANTALEDGSAASGNKTLSLKQILGTRKVRVGDLVKSGVTNNNGNNNGITTNSILVITGESGSEPSQSCHDSDIAYGSNAIYYFGNCSDPLGTTNDVCSDAAHLNERVCVTSTQCGTQMDISCSGGCSNGKCMRAYTPSPSLKYKLAWQTTSENGCAFQIIVKGESTSGIRNLHYYYKVNNACNHPAANSTDKYIEMNLPEESSENDFMNWDVKEIDLYQNWTSPTIFGAAGENDNVTEIYFVSYVKETADYIGYGQKVWMDYIKLEKGDYTEPSIDCKSRNKKCCAEGTGFENYIGDELNCTSGYECWSSCTNSTKLTFISFISKSGKSNRTSGHCQAIVDGNIVDLLDECITPGGVGKGYTACTINTTSGTCSNWLDNTYRVNFSTTGINLKSPNADGTYTLRWRFEYLPSLGDCNFDTPEIEPCLIFEKNATFIVGNVSSCTANWNCGNYSECINLTQSRVCVDLNQCPENGPSYTRTEVAPCGTGGCSPGSFQCSGTVYQQCSADGTTWGTVVDCSNQSQSCDINYNGCYTPCTPNCENIACNGDDGCGGVCVNNCKESGNFPWMIVIIALVVVVIVIVLLLVLKKKKPKVDYGSSGSGMQSSTMPSSGMSGASSTSQYPEVVSYIKDAVAAGASKPDIKSKLLEAGWPDDVIDQSFRDVGM